MAEVRIQIGGREFEVACRDGEEHFLLAAAQMLDTEASALNESLGRMPESRMLLMSGLMLADKTASLEDKLKNSEPVASAPPAPADNKRVQRLERQLADTQAELADAKAKLAEAEAGQGALEQARRDAEEQAAHVKTAIDQRDATFNVLKRVVEKVEKAVAD